MLPTNERSRCVSHTKMEFAVVRTRSPNSTLQILTQLGCEMQASTSQPSTDLEMLPINVEDLSHSLLMVRVMLCYPVNFHYCFVLKSWCFLQASKNIKHNELKRLSTVRELVAYIMFRIELRQSCFDFRRRVFQEPSRRAQIRRTGKAFSVYVICTSRAQIFCS